MYLQHYRVFVVASLLVRHLTVMAFEPSVMGCVVVYANITIEFVSGLTEH